MHPLRTTQSGLRGADGDALAAVGEAGLLRQGEPGEGRESCQRIGGGGIRAMENRRGDPAITAKRSKQMETYQELLAQKAAIDAQIEEARKAELATAVGEVKRLVGEYGLTAADCGFGAPAKNTKYKVPVKYRGPNGEAWTGRGKTPAWVIAQEAAGRTRESLLAN
jgi:DNA-binding protein H-NS